MRSRRPAALARALVCGLGLAALSACGGPDKPAARTPGNPTGPGPTGPVQSSEGEVVLAGAVVQASAAAATEVEAYEQALGTLRVTIFGPFLEDAPSLPVHDREQDLHQRDELGDGRIRVTIGLGRERLDALLQAVVAQPLPAAVPPQLADGLAAPYKLFLEAMTCERRQVLLADDTCEQPAHEEIEMAIMTVAREVQLRMRLAGGVPLDAEDRPLRPIDIVVERVPASGAPIPLAGVPLRITQLEGVDVLTDDTEAVTGHDGVARFELKEGAQWAAGMVVSLDREAFLGPMAGMWPERDRAPIARPADMHRWALVATERVQGNRARTAVFGASLDRAARASGGAGMLALPPDALRRLTAAAPTALPAMLPGLADELQGKLDVLLVAEIDSEFASRMGDYRVWYEARGRVQAFDAWTGKRLAEISDAVSASGVGDERADQAARAQLAEKLATELGKIPRVTR